MKFKGTKKYVSTEDLSMAVNASVTLERPLLIKGEPGTGKTLLAIEVAESLGKRLIEWHIKSTTKAFVVDFICHSISPVSYTHLRAHETQ